MVQPTLRQPRACGSVALAVGQRSGRSVIADLRQEGSLKCLFPRPYGRTLDAVLVNTAGGITGGDVFGVAATVGAGASLTLTTQAAERAYRAGPDQTGILKTRITVADGGHVNWVPQETILFDAHALTRRLSVDLAPGATILLCEPLLFGRLAMGETAISGAFDDRIEIRRAGAPLFLDAVRIKGDVTGHLDRPHIANGARAMATVVFVAPNAEARLTKVRSLLPDTGGTSVIGDDVLAIRILARDGFDLRRSLIPVLTHLLQDDLPRTWMI